MKKLMTVGPLELTEIPSASRGMIGGKVICTNIETGEKQEKVWKRFHNGKDDKMAVMALLISQMAPKEEPETMAEEKTE